MEIFISVLAVIVATGCFATIMTADWRESRRHRHAKVNPRPTDENQ
jgi:hypothetical protein